MTKTNTHWDIFRKNGEKYALVLKKKGKKVETTSLKTPRPEIREKRINNHFVVRMSQTWFKR
jgi:hypothetical protein